MSNSWLVAGDGLAKHWNFWLLFVNKFVNDLNSVWSLEFSSVSCKYIKSSVTGLCGCGSWLGFNRFGDWGELEADRFRRLICESMLSFLRCPFATGFSGVVSDDDVGNRNVNSTLLFLPFVTFFGWRGMKFWGFESIGDRKTRYHPLIGLRFYRD